MSSRASASSDLHVEDFTEESYRRIIRAAKTRWRFEPFGTRCEEPHVLWRHDVDLSVHRALAIAQIEAEEGVRGSYFLSLHSSFYNLLERSVADRARRILSLGHQLGLHFDSDFYAPLQDEDALTQRVSAEAGLLEDVLERRVDAVSFHNPDFGHVDLTFDSDEIGGLVNAYGRSLRERYAYVSDSNGYWRFRRLPEVVADGTEERLHVLTHPEWWQTAPMPPRQRVVRCVEERAAWTLGDYDRLLAEAERLNVG